MAKEEKVLSHFKENDSRMHGIASEHGIDPLHTKHVDNYFERLCSAIVSQQLSVKAAKTIWGRFLNLFPDADPDPNSLLNIEHGELRAVGLSNAKANYVRGIAEKFAGDDLKIHHYDEMDNEEVIADLLQLKGVGRWTAEMFLMFTLGREDLFSVGDLGLRRGMIALYELEDPPYEELEEIARRWSPYRTYACTALWNWQDAD